MFSIKEIKEIVTAFDEARKNNKRTALATVVEVEGSSYRKAGARMLVTEDGQLTGAISGGCLEGDALRKALLVMSQQKPMLATYDTTDEDDAKLGVGLGCNGIIHILIEPIDPEGKNTPIDFFRALFKERQKAVIVTLYSLENRNGEQYGTCFFLNESGIIMTPLRDQNISEEIREDANSVLEENASALKNYTIAGQKLNAFVELIKPAVALNVIGAGNDVIPLVQMASIMGWETSIFDGRNNYATAQRFPSAGRVIISKPGQVLSQIQIDEHAVFVIMTHNYNYDLAMLRQLIPLKISYIGVLGPKKKLNALLNELETEGLNFSGEQLEKVYGPVGLDIGAKTSEEIALSIISEINSVLQGAHGGSLREKHMPVTQETINSHAG